MSAKEGMEPNALQFCSQRLADELSASARQIFTACINFLYHPNEKHNFFSSSIRKKLTSNFINQYCVVSKNLCTQKFVYTNCTINKQNIFYLLMTYLKMTYLLIHENLGHLQCDVTHPLPFFHFESCL